MYQPSSSSTSAGEDPFEAIFGQAMPASQAKAIGWVDREPPHPSPGTLTLWPPPATKRKKSANYTTTNKKPKRSEVAEPREFGIECIRGARGPRDFGQLQAFAVDTGSAVGADAWRKALVQTRAWQAAWHACWTALPKMAPLLLRHSTQSVAFWCNLLELRAASICKDHLAGKLVYAIQGLTDRTDASWHLMKRKAKAPVARPVLSLEGDSAERDLDPLLAALPWYRRRAAETGDICLCLDGRPVRVYERKTMPDLVGGIRSGRYRNQRDSLAARHDVASSQVTYLLEGPSLDQKAAWKSLHLPSLNPSMPTEHVIMSTLSTLTQHYGFGVTRTGHVLHTACLVLADMHALAKHGRAAEGPTTPGASSSTTGSTLSLARRASLASSGHAEMKAGNGFRIIRDTPSATSVAAASAGAVGGESRAEMKRSLVSTLEYHCTRGVSGSIAIALAKRFPHATALVSYIQYTFQGRDSTSAKTRNGRKKKKKKETKKAKKESDKQWTPGEDDECSGDEHGEKGDFGQPKPVWTSDLAKQAVASIADMQYVSNPGAPAAQQRSKVIGRGVAIRLLCGRGLLPCSVSIPAAMGQAKALRDAAGRDATAAHERGGGPMCCPQ